MTNTNKLKEEFKKLWLKQEPEQDESGIGFGFEMTKVIRIIKWDFTQHL